MLVTQLNHQGVQSSTHTIMGFAGWCVLPCGMARGWESKSVESQQDDARSRQQQPRR